MKRVPIEFCDEFEEKGDSFFEIANLLYSNPDRHYTQDELAEEVNRSKTTISNHTRDMVDSDWVDRQKNQTTFAWNIDAHNPANTEGITAAKRFYSDFWHLVKKHSATVPGAFAIVGFTFILAAVVLFAFFVGFSIGITRESALPHWVYLTIALGSFLVGVIVTFLSPLQALVNRAVWALIPKDLFQKGE